MTNKISEIIQELEIIKNRIYNDKKLIKIPAVNDKLLLLSTLKYKPLGVYKSDFTNVFDNNLVKICYLVIQEIYKIEGEEKILYKHPLLENKIFAKIEIEENDLDTYLISTDNNINNLSYGILENNQFIPTQIKNKQDKNFLLLKKNTYIDNTDWYITNYEIIPPNSFLIEVERKQKKF